MVSIERMMDIMGMFRNKTDIDTKPEIILSQRNIDNGRLLFTVYVRVVWKKMGFDGNGFEAEDFIQG